VITTLLVIPLMLTLPPLQAMVRASLMPETVMFSPAGAVDTDVDGIDGMVAVAVGLAVGMLGMGEKVVMPLRETWCAVKRKIAAGRAIMPMTKTPTMIHNVRLLREYWVDGLGNKPPL
jgi:hypothetical protein